jgi:hypothetical protein
MRLQHARRLAQREPQGFENQPLTAAERRHIALAALQIQEQRYRLKLAQIEHERRGLLAGAAQ